MLYGKIHRSFDSLQKNPTVPDTSVDSAAKVLGFVGTSCAISQRPVGAQTCCFVCVESPKEIFHTYQVSRSVALGLYLGHIFSGAIRRSQDHTRGG